MTRSPSRTLRTLLPARRGAALAVTLAGAAAVLSACGSQGVQVAASSPYYKGAEIFANHCAGCHTLGIAGTQGSAYNVRTREYKDGPNFDQRKEQVQDVLYALRNGGFSSGPMPQDIVTGASAEAVARFVAHFSGSKAAHTPQPSAASTPGASTP